MAAPLPYDIRGIHAKIYTWLEDYVGVGKALKAYQNAPQPAFPYATVWQRKIVHESEFPSSVTLANQLDATSIDIIRGVPIKLFFDISIYSNTTDVSLDAAILMERALRDLEKVDQMEEWRRFDMNVTAMGRPMSIPEKQNERWIQRVTTELVITCWSASVETIETIQSVGAEAPTLIAPFTVP